MAHTCSQHSALFVGSLFEWSMQGRHSVKLCISLIPACLPPGRPACLPALLDAGSRDVSEEAPRLLLLYLADRWRAAHASAASARTFMLCQVREGRQKKVLRAGC